MKAHERKIGRHWVHWGFITRSLNLGIQVDKYGFDINLLFFYVGMEWRSW